MNIINPVQNVFVFSSLRGIFCKAIALLKKGFNVAWVFNKLPTEHKGFKVINGDESDNRIGDEKNVIVGLRYKNATGANGAALNLHAKTSGFVTFI